MRRTTGIIILFALASAMSVFLFVREQHETRENMVFGVTFSGRAAEFLSLDAHAAFLAVLDDLGVKQIRLPLYWNAIETAPSVYDFTDVDWYVHAAAASSAELTLVVGLKTPRWPECHAPQWIDNANRRDALLAYIRAVVSRYREEDAVVRWQVENEPHFPFGVCPTPDLALLEEELTLVKSIDPDTPIQMTVSGENEPWAASVGMADVLGFSLYRFAWNESFGLFVFPHPPEFYALQAKSIQRAVETVVISELQAEPWLQDGMLPESAKERYALFPVERLEEHIAFARAIGVNEVSLWGVEWWYALRQLGDARLWEAGKRVVVGGEL